MTDDNTHISKKLSWIDINNETKKCYYKKIILNQNKIRNDEITVEQFAEFLPTVSVEVNIQASGAEEYYVKDMSYAIEDGEIQYGIKYEFAPKNCADIFRVVKEVVSQTEINDANLKEVKMNLLPVEYYNYSIKVSDGSNVPYDTLRMFKYEALEAERDDFSKTKNQLGSKFLVDLLKDRLSDQDKLKIEKEYSHFFEALKEISDINDIINWQETSELKGAKKFFSHINILPNMPPMQSILSSVRLGYSEEELSMQGLGYRNLVLLFVLINSLLGKETDIALDVLTIEEPEAHLCINNTRLMVMTLLSNWEKIDSRRYGIIINLFEDESPIKQEDKIFVKSIDYIKGMEGEKCLFILTNDLAAHLFNNNTETNKTKNKLYVALTRSLNELSIYILKEVEDKYTKKRIQDFFERYL